MKGLVMAVHLVGAMNTRPSRNGTRKDGKVCDAKPGECRDNSKYYSRGLKDEKSWSLPYSDDTCSRECWYLVDPK